MSRRIAQIRLVSSHPEVYEPCDDSFALVDALLADRNNLLEHKPRLCMEVGCGSGYVITSLALILGQQIPGVYYIATDLNPHAINVTRETLESHDVDAELIATDIASGLENRLEGKIDVMVVNPPYVPTLEDEVGREGIASAWAGGQNGRRVIDRILPVADKLLSGKGWLYMVTLTENHPSQICVDMRKRGYASRIVVQRSTEEESLHIIKFWRDPDTQIELKKTLTSNKTIPQRVMESLVSQSPQSSFWRNDEISIKFHDDLQLHNVRNNVHIQYWLWASTKTDFICLPVQGPLPYKTTNRHSQTIYGDIYDCVDFYQQPAFDNPLLKNHSFHPEMKPTSYPKGRSLVKNSTSAYGSKKLWANGKGCPTGSVPIRRITKDDLIKAKKAGELYASNLNIQNAERPGFYFAVLHTQHDQSKLKYYGAGMMSAVYNPKLNATSQYSSSQLKIQNGQENIIVGWTVHPGVYPDSQTRFFIYTNAKDKHCFNNFCDLFIQVRADIPLDFVFNPISQIGISTYSEPFFIYRDVANGNWFLEIAYGSDANTIVGWWPSKVFTGLANFGSYIEWGGEVYTPDHIPAPEMGSGQFAALDNRYVASCTNLKTINEANQIVDALNLVPLEDTSEYYYVKDAGYYRSDLQHLMFYGGRGRVKR